MKRGASEHEAAVQAALDRVRARCDTNARRAADPVEFVHRYEGRHDQEIVALIASSLAFGNVKALRAKIEDALFRLGPQVAAVADDPGGVFERLRGWKHRVYRDVDLARLIIGARRLQHREGSLGRALVREIHRTPDLRVALGELVVKRWRNHPA